MVLVIMEFCILMILVLTWLDNVMQIGQEVLMIGKAPQVDASFWEVILYHGSTRSKIVYLCPLLRQNILLLVVVVLSYFG